MPQAPAKILLFLLILMLSFGAVGCRASTPPPPTITNTWTPVPTSTVTYTPTITLTTTPANTITPLPSKTPTITPTPYRTLSPTPTPSEVPSRPAVLFPYQDVNGRTVDWSYFHVTQIGVNQFDDVNNLWAFMAFQLLDRGIHQRIFHFLGNPITVYFLNVAHAFDGEMLPMQLVLGGTPGENVPVHIIPAGGTAYIQMQVRDFEQGFDPYITHRDANRDYELRATDYPYMFLKDLGDLLPTFPEEVILLADHPILFPRDDWAQIKLDMSRVSYLAARYQPFFEIDDYDRLVDQSDFAYALRDYVLDQEPMPLGYYAYSSQTLIIIQGEE